MCRGEGRKEESKREGCFQNEVEREGRRRREIQKQRRVGFTFIHLVEYKNKEEVLREFKSGQEKEKRKKNEKEKKSKLVTLETLATISL